MDKVYADARYSSCRVQDLEQGYVGLELMRASRQGDGSKQRIARVVYWESCGEFFVETFGTDVPLPIIEELIAEAKESIKYC